jgi:CheY-like chemotaxis protein
MTPTRPAALPDLTGLTILVIEDNFDALNLIRAILETAGAHPLLATHTGQARDYLRTRKVNLILCDLNLPAEDGAHFMQWLRTRPADEGGDVPSLAITAHYEDFPLAAARGFSAYLRKPLQMDRLCLTIAALCGRNQADTSEPAAGSAAF